MKNAKAENSIFGEWCDTMIQCQSDRTLKHTLLPVLEKFSDVRIVQSRLETLLSQPRSHCWIVPLLLCLRHRTETPEDNRGRSSALYTFAFPEPENDRDVLRILTAYRKVAGIAFWVELDKTVAAMKSGSYEDALLRLAARVGSPMLSEVVRGLIGTIRGDDQTIYFEMFSHDMQKLEQNRLEKEAERQPAKIRKYSMLMLLCIVLIYAVVLCSEMIGSLGAIF